MSENNTVVPTAEELIKHLIGLEDILRQNGIYDEVVERMNVHGRNHVRAALKEAAEKAKTTTTSTSIIIDKDSILNAYDLTKIK